MTYDYKKEERLSGEHTNVSSRGYFVFVHSQDKILNMFVLLISSDIVKCTTLEI